MNISAILLAPMSFLYGIATRFRNYLYNIGYSRSFNYDIMVIAVGNLSAGGTGKSPMAEYLIRLLHKKYTLATLSRGYKRKTKGFLIADENTRVEEIGDEPFQMYLKYSSVAKIAVGEERSIAIPNILLEYPETQVIIMDDGFQHRTVKPDFCVLLTDYNHLFYNDHLLPWGRLREAKVGAKRAHVILITKCPESLNEKEENDIVARVRKHAGTGMPVFFSKIIYRKAKEITKSGNRPDRFIAFAGLADSGLFAQHVKENYDLIDMISFDDHHNYSAEEIKGLVERAKNEGAGLITTEKDVVKFREEDKIKLLEGVPLYYIAIEHQFMKDGNIFDTLVYNAILEKYATEE